MDSEVKAYVAHFSRCRHEPEAHRNRQTQGLAIAEDSTIPYGSWRELRVPEHSAERGKKTLILEPDKSVLASSFNQVVWNQLPNVPKLGMNV